MDLNDHQKRIRDGLIKKLVANSRAMISNQIAIPLGVVKMSKIIIRINDIDPIRDVGLDVFLTYMSQIGNLPVGTDRLLYNPAFLKQQDVQLDKLTAFYKEKIFDACFEIIDKFRQTE